MFGRKVYRHPCRDESEIYANILSVCILHSLSAFLPYRPASLERSAGGRLTTALCDRHGSLYHLL